MKPTHFYYQFERIIFCAIESEGKYTTTGRKVETCDLHSVSELIGRSVSFKECEGIIVDIMSDNNHFWDTKYIGRYSLQYIQYPPLFQNSTIGIFWRKISRNGIPPYWIDFKELTILNLK